MGRRWRRRGALRPCGVGSGSGGRQVSPSCRPAATARSSRLRRGLAGWNERSPSTAGRLGWCSLCRSRLRDCDYVVLAIDRFPSETVDNAAKILPIASAMIESTVLGDAQFDPLIDRFQYRANCSGNPSGSKCIVSANPGAVQNALL
jgi:hypothetical protein